MTYETETTCAILSTPGNGYNFINMANPILDFKAASQRLNGVVKHTPLEYNAGLSEKYECELYLKREDLQIVRSYKLRGAFNMISQLTEEELGRGVVCASAARATWCGLRSATARTKS